MRPSYLFIFLLITPFLMFAQSIPPQDTKDDCDGKWFTKTEELPTLKISKQAFADSLTLQVKANDAFDPNARFTVHFLLTRKSQVMEVERINGGFPKPGFNQAFLSVAKFWLPARQNNRDVCSYVKCDIEMREDGVLVNIRQ